MSYPVSFAQRRLWLVDQLSPHSSLYNMWVALRLRGSLDEGALTRALTKVVARHEALRTRFALEDGEPVQVIGPAEEFEVPVLSVEGADSAELQRIIADEAKRPFDLGQGPLVRARLLRLNPDDHALVLALHHIVGDGWSMGVLYRELGTLYRAECSGETAALGPLPLQYRHYAAWQRQRLQGPVLEGELRYWREQLAGAPPKLTLPTDRPRPPEQRHRGASESLPLPPTLATALRALARAEGATLFMTLLSAYAVLLGRYSGQTDVVIGTPIAGRTRSELEGLIGFFVNTLPLRISLSDAPSFRALLRRVREVALGAYAHQELPFERLVEELRPPRSLQHHPVFQALFALQNAPRSPLQLPGIEVERIRVSGESAKFDLAMFASEGNAELRVGVEYDSDLFDAATVARMLAHYRALLEQVSVDPDRPLDEVELMTESERRRVLVEWNDTASPMPERQSIPELFEAQVGRTPEAVALVTDDGSLSYAELDRRADRLARRLRASGVGLESRVGVFLDRSPELVVALLAVLKAGGAYVPLAPDTPPARAKRMLQDAKARHLVSTDLLAAGLGPFDGVIIGVDDAVGSGDPGAQATLGGVSSYAGPDNLAYVMYTSGSTGLPKGVAVTHRNVIRLVTGSRYASLGADEVFLLFASVAFDASTLEVWAPLLNGGRLAIAPPGLLRLDELGEVLRRHQVTTLWLTSALFNLMVDERCGDLGAVRQLLTGGDVVSPEHVARVRREHPRCRVINGYGPTETTTFATTATITGPPSDGARLPIGRPIQNTRVYVLDTDLRLQPAGVPGELYIGGAGVARGYQSEPALTAQRFLPDPFAGEPGARMYRTGDIVRWRDDGALDFLGRRDHQVKIRGFRVEPGEVQALLARHPGVRTVAVIPRRAEASGHQLIAYVVPAADSFDAEELRRFLRISLPEYMVPNDFVWLDQLPLNRNGKVDFTALDSLHSGTRPPSIEGTARMASRGLEPAAPYDPTGRSITEAKLSAIWSELLGVQPIGPDDDFFSLGGHSLLAIKLFARLEQAFAVKLPLATLFHSPTVAALAAEVDRAVDQHQGQALVPLQPLGTRPPLFLVHNVWGDLLRYRPLALRLGTDQPVFGFEAPVAENGYPEVRTMEEIAQAYVEELRRFRPDGPYLLCGYCAAGALTLEMGRQLRASGAAVPLLAVIDGACPGYGRPPSRAVRLLRRVNSFRKRLMRNLRLLPTVAPGELGAFVSDRLGKIVVRALGVPAYKLSVRLRRPLLPVLRHQHGVLSHATQVYQPGRYDGTITLIRSPRIPRGKAGTPTLGWERVANRGVELLWVEAHHLTMMQEPFVGEVADHLQTSIDQALRREAGEAPVG